MLIVILAGGVGKRLWPLGRKNKPKQFFPIITEKSLAQETYAHFSRAYPKEKIFFATTKDLLPYLKKLFPKIPISQFIVEPARRDTGPAMGYAAALLSVKYPDEPLVFAPSDHHILDEEKYLRAFKAGEDLIKQTGCLADIGIPAEFPSTILGYTKIGAKFGESYGLEIYRFAGHTEKPNLATAQKYLAAGNYLWHGNYYMWTPRLFLEAFEAYAPELGRVLSKIRLAFANKKIAEAKKLYEKMPKISFDYAVTEKIDPEKVLIIKGDFGWSDVGAWDVLHNQMKHRGDELGNVAQGRVVSVDTKNCLLYTQKKKVLAALGLEDLIVVDTEDALLVCPKDRAQDVKKLLEAMEEQGWEDYL